MAYKVYINNNNLLFDSSLQDESFLLSKAQLHVQAGSSGSFDFILPPSNEWHGQLHRLTDFIDVYRDDDKIWSGRVFSITDQFDGQQAVSCEGLLAVLSDTVYRPEVYDGTLLNLVARIVQSHNSQVDQEKQITIGDITVTDADVYREYKNYETSISRLQDLVSSFGGYLMARNVNGTIVLDWLEDFIDSCTQAIELTSNLISLTTRLSSEDIATVLIPLGGMDDDGNNITIAPVNEGLDYIQASEEYIEKYGLVTKTVRWDDVDQPRNLLRKAQEYLAYILVPKTEVELTAVDLADAGYDVDAFRVGQKISVTSRAHGIDAMLFACMEQKLDLLNPGSNKLSLGEVKPGYVKTQQSVISQSVRNELENQQKEIYRYVKSASDLINGNKGGYVVFHDSDGDTRPDEILIMDTPDMETAVKIWRWNNSGLGYSSDGGQTYDAAITMGGSIVANMITTGTLDASLLKAGIIRGQQGGSYWNLNTGELHIEGSADVDKSKVFVTTPTPPYYIGDLWITERSETSAVVGYAIIGEAIAGDDSAGEGGQIMTCVITRTSGNFDESEWRLLTNFIDDSDLQILEQRVSSAELNIAANTASIQLKADVSIIDDLGNRISTAETEIAQNSHEIELRAVEADITGDYVIGKINLQSTTAQIAARNIDLQGAVTISSFDYETQGQLVVNTTSKNQYYLSNSQEELSGGSWSDRVRWYSGKYIWTRIATTRTFADQSTAVTYSDAFYDENLTTALSTSEEANTTAAGALGATVSCYYRSTSTTTPSISESTSIGTSDNTDNAWEYVLPRPSYGKTFFTCERYTSKDGTVTFSTVRKMSNMTVSSLWCSANDSSYIDGGHIYASTVTADKMSVSDLYAIGATIGGWQIDSNSIHTNNVAITSNAANSVGLSSSTFTRTLNGTSRSGLKFAIGSKFGVTSDGTLYASGGNFSGTITSSSATITGGSFNVNSTSASYNIITASYTDSYNRKSTCSLSAGALSLESSDGHCRGRLNASIIGLVGTNGNEIGANWYLKTQGDKTSYMMFDDASGGSGVIVINSPVGRITANSFNNSSDRNVKRGIKSLDKQKSADFIYNGLDPCSFYYINAQDEVSHHGFVAQDVESGIKRCLGENDWGIVTTPNGEDESVAKSGNIYKSLAYSELIADIVATLQTQNERISRLEAM